MIHAITPIGKFIFQKPKWLTSRCKLSSQLNQSQFTDFTVCPSESGSDECCASYKFCFEEGLYYTHNLNATTLGTTCQKCWCIYCGSFENMTSRLNIYGRPVLQDFVITLCAINLPLKLRQTTKMVLHLSLHFKSYHGNYFMIIICLLIMIGKKGGN